MIGINTNHTVALISEASGRNAADMAQSQNSNIHFAPPYAEGAGENMEYKCGLLPV